MDEHCYVAVDVGTTSVRAAVISKTGKLLTFSSQDIEIWKPSCDMYEQSSENVWSSLCAAVQKACILVNKDKIFGIGFDATCSLVVLDKYGKPISVSANETTNQNIILWMDHRAVKEAEIINDTHHNLLNYVGGKISPEMQAPKILWLKNNLDCERWRNISLFFDLPDFLTYKATGYTSRSLCSVACKFNYFVEPFHKLNNESSGWIPSFWESIGLEEFVRDDFERLGKLICDPGTKLGKGLTIEAAKELNLPIGLPVAASLIDAHAGGLGMIGANIDCELSSVSLTSRLAIISGTSSCHLVVSNDATFVPGVWGPYYSAMIPKYWLNEGGQSATGELIDYVLHTHPAWKLIVEKANLSHSTVHEEVEFTVNEFAKNLEHYAYLAEDCHVYPDFHGNRSPIADASLKGMLTGLSLAKDLKNLVSLYVSTIQAIACGTKQIIDRLNASGFLIKVIMLCGGLSKNRIFVECHSDVTGLPVILPRESESTLVGSAILAANAAGDFNSIEDAMTAMSASGKTFYPNNDLKRFYEKKYEIFMKMQEDQLVYRQIMAS